MRHVHHHLKPSPVNGAALNLAMGVFGVSILAMPSAFQGVGIIAGLMILTAIGLLTIVSIYFLAHAMETLDLYSYEALSKRLLGPWSVRAARWMLFIFNFGDCVSYVIVSGRLLEPLHEILADVLAGSDTTAGQWAAAQLRRMGDAAILWTVLYWLLVMFPLSFVRKVTILQKLSGLAVLALLYITWAVVYRYWVPLEGGLMVHPRFGGGHEEGSTAMSSFLSRITKGFLSVPIMMFAFDCQALVFQLYTSLEHDHRTVESMLKVTVRAIVMAWAVFIVIGLVGYLSFGDATPDNILRGYNPKTDPVFAVAYALFLVPATVAFALVLFPVRDVVLDALEEAGWPTPLHRCSVQTGSVDGDDESLRAPDDTSITKSNEDTRCDDYERGEKSFRAVSAALSIGCVVTAVAAPRLDIVFGLLGGLCSSCLCFLFPAAYRLRMSYEGLAPITNVVLWRVSWGMVVLGVFGAIFGTAAGVFELIHQYDPAIA